MTKYQRIFDAFSDTFDITPTNSEIDDFETCLNEQGLEIVDSYKCLTIQALQMRNEIFAGAGMDRETFTETYLNGLGDYERDVAAEEGIEI